MLKPEPKTKIKCNVTVECEKCENHRINWPICFVEQRGWEEKRTTLVGHKCTRYGHCNETAKWLKKGGWMDDLVYLERGE